MIADALERVRRTRPLVHHITNWVTIYDCAAVTRSFGGLPVMAHAPEEAGDMASMASSLVLNIGTLTVPLVDAMLAAGQSANARGIPVVLDAVGVGATAMRDLKAKEIIDTVSLDIIKGNASEIARLAGENVTTRGVETTDVGGDLDRIAGKLAMQRKAVVVITGKHDIVSDGATTFHVENGHDLMGAVVGTGCMAGSVIGTFAGAGENRLRDTVAALACFGIAGELAGRESGGPGTFKVQLFDEAYNLNADKIERMVRVDEVIA